MSLDQPQEDGCNTTTFERKYYHREGSFVKRCLRPKEFRTGFRGLHPEIPIYY
ncbi:hypothetical protein F5Y19DRAFT_446496 [Xylariaceae sp. FL1651]|nr:hypothetical protein F5Y19DRAFT_446496 [Xylariaceae sp. FL1651]